MRSCWPGVELDDGPAQLQSCFAAGGEGANRWYRVVIKEGRKREVRRLFEHFGLTVSRLTRIRFGPIALPPQLRRGQKMELDDDLVARVLEWAGMAPSPRRQMRGVPDKHTRKPRIR